MVGAFGRFLLKFVEVKSVHKGKIFVIVNLTTTGVLNCLTDEAKLGLSLKG